MNLMATGTFRVVERRPDGSAVVEMTVLHVATLDRALTAGGGEGSIEITREMLAQAARNFDAYPGPVPVGIEDHRSFSDRASAQDAFIESMRVEGDALVARIWVSADVAPDVTKGKFRGFSVEIAPYGMTLPSADLEGAVVYGGIFTNRPAAPVNNLLPVAASVATCVVTREMSPGDPQAERTETMSEKISLEAVQAQLEAKTTECDVLKRANLDTAKTVGELRAVTERQAEAAGKASLEIANLKADLQMAKANAQQFEAKATELASKLSASEKRAAELAADIAKRDEAVFVERAKSLRDAALQAGVTAKTFDGFDADPKSFVIAKFGSLEALGNLVNFAIPAKKEEGKAVPSSRLEKADDAISTNLSAEEKQKAAEYGVDLAGNFAGIRDAKSAALIAKKLEAAKKN